MPSLLTLNGDLLDANGSLLAGTDINCKHFVWKQTAPALNTWFTMVSGDADVASHYNDISAKCFVVERTDATQYGLAFSFASNTGIGYCAADAGIYANAPANTSFNVGNNSIKLSSGTSGSGAIHATSNGDIRIYSSSSNNVVRVGTYDIWFVW